MVNFSTLDLNQMRPKVTSQICGHSSFELQTSMFFFYYCHRVDYTSYSRLASAPITQQNQLFLKSWPTSVALNTTY